MYSFRIHMEFADGTKDYIDLSGDTIDEIREQANDHVERRKPDNYWSEEI